jgi:2-oxoisovalerate dehydrogenase E1 component beta subunit
LTVVVPRSPLAAKGLLLASIRSPDPVVFLEPKALYRASVEDVPEGDYELPLRKADVVREGRDVTVVGWGGQMRVLERACDLAREQLGAECELVDLQTLLPWDKEAVARSVDKTGKLVVSHEAPVTSGFGAEIVSAIQERCFWNLQAPIRRVCGYDTPFPLAFERYYVPDELKVLEAIRSVVEEAR